MTYRQAWETYLKPHLDSRADDRPQTVTSPGANAPPVEVQRGIADQMCGGRKYDGEMWWLETVKANERGA